ncbi:MAG: hypothetical protein AAB388_01455 [Patescibacteria group bacterium]
MTIISSTGDVIPTWKIIIKLLSVPALVLGAFFAFLSLVLMIDPEHGIYILSDETVFTTRLLIASPVIAFVSSYSGFKLWKI